MTNVAKAVKVGRHYVRQHDWKKAINEKVSGFKLHRSNAYKDWIIEENIKSFITIEVNSHTHTHMQTHAYTLTHIHTHLSYNLSSFIKR